MQTRTQISINFLLPVGVHLYSLLCARASEDLSVVVVVRGMGVGVAVGGGRGGGLLALDMA